jgi:putative ABC transport system permease protein
MDQMSPRSHPLADMQNTAVVDLRQQIGGAGDAPNPDADYQIGDHTGLGLTFAMRVDGAPLTIATVREAIRDVDPRLAFESLATMGDVVGGLIGRQRFYALVTTLFGTIAGLIAAIGVYGVLAYAMTQRRQEFGVRLALGAEPRHVLRLAMRHGMVLAAIGIATGIGGAVALTRYLAGMLAGVTPLDPATYVAVVLVFAAMSLLASFVPARLATRVDPVIALRYE